MLFNTPERFFVLIVWFLFALVMFVMGLKENDECRICGSAAIFTAFIVVPIIYLLK